LIARFYPVKRDSTDKQAWDSGAGGQAKAASATYSRDRDEDGDFEVQAPISDANREYTFGWHSPFENSGSGSLFPTLSSMLQSGTADQIVRAIKGRFSNDQDSGDDGELARLAATLQSAEGRTGITKLNSTQVFLGMQPVKVSMTLHFRALVDPESEVRKPIAKLLEWGLPQFLANEGLLAGAIRDFGKGIDVQTVFPSLAPRLIGFEYGDTTMLPMVIENISEPITTPRNIQGYQISTSIQITLSSLTAFDRNNVKALYR
jgi:hypothetical protein